MFIKSNNSKKEFLSGREIFIPEIDLVPEDLKIKLFNKFKGN